MKGDAFCRDRETNRQYLPEQLINNKVNSATFMIADDGNFLAIVPEMLIFTQLTNCDSVRRPGAPQRAHPMKNK